jgi:hypothetical protein
MAEGKNEILMQMAPCQDGAHPSLLRIKAVLRPYGLCGDLMKRELVGFGLEDFAG